MRIGVIDCGTNTFNLLICEVENGIHEILYQTKTAVKMAQGGISKNFITADAQRRCIDAIIDYKKTLEHYQVTNYYCFATSGMRSTSNGLELARAIYKETNIHVEIIDGNQEAELIYHGVNLAQALNENTSLIMDIGGGSTEFILGNESEILWKQSFQLGVSRIKETLNPSDPITPSQINNLMDLLDVELSPLKLAIKKYPTDRLIGSSGSFDSFYEMMAHRNNSSKLTSVNCVEAFNLDWFKSLHTYLLDTNLEERLQIKGLISMRADMIVLSGILIDYIVTTFDIRQAVLSKYALKEGVLSLIIQNKLN